MTTVANKNEIMKNLEVFESYLCEGSENDQFFCRELIKKGRCFVAYKIGKEIRFSPSRYIGYKNNSAKAHEERDKNGTETNAAINKILGNTPYQDDDLENKYLHFCKNLGISPDNKARKYWHFNVPSKKFSGSASQVEDFPEGKIVERTHKARERNAKLIAQAKKEFLKTNKRLICEACNFDFENVYGARGKGYIEAHHVVPVSLMKSQQITNIKDIAMVCANCHKILHRTRPWLSISELKKLLVK
jgi:5-methylcytosine-specific restriction protein A